MDKKQNSFQPNIANKQKDIQMNQDDYQNQTDQQTNFQCFQQFYIPQFQYFNQQLGPQQQQYMMIQQQQQQFFQQQIQFYNQMIYQNQLINIQQKQAIDHDLISQFQKMNLYEDTFLERFQEIKDFNQINPVAQQELPEQASFFVIKSYSIDNIIQGIKYGVWCSTRVANQKFNQTYTNNPNQPVYFIFSANNSGQFCAVGQMTSEVDLNVCFPHWEQHKKWYGVFNVKFLYVKDIPNKEFKHLRNHLNQNKPISNSKDSQEIPYKEGKQALQIFHQFQHSSSLLSQIQK